ncbi:MAG: hypothetical protein KGL39_41035 [Patescibacteria group bacterium]|nr:hypothetical protein [Patescibacteria group bacterium]
MASVKAKRLSKSAVDGYALLSEKRKALEKDIKALGDQIRAVLVPGGRVSGYAFAVEMSEVPQMHQAVNYREQLIAVKGERFVTELEATAFAAPTTDGTPRLLVKPNADVNVDDIARGVRLRKELLEAVSDGSSSKQIADIVREELS